LCGVTPVGDADLTLTTNATPAGIQQHMALSVLASQVAGTGRLASEPFTGRLPGLALFGGGMVVGGLVAAIANWVREHAWAWTRWALPRMPQLTAMPAAACTSPVPASPVPASPVQSGDTPAGPFGVPPAGCSLRIGVLGSLTINGHAGALLPAQSQLIVSLALHESGLSNRQLRALLGTDPAHPKPADSLRQLIARTRRALGRADDGKEWIEHLGHGRYALHPHARVDWHEFEALRTEGMSLGRTGPLTDALSMVRGQPFTGCYYWWLETALIESITASIVTVACALAELSLLDRDPAAAVRASRIGLTADPSAEPLWRLLMRSEHAAGNLAGVREAWRRCVAVMAEVAADGLPDADTADVFRELTATNRQLSQTLRDRSSRVFPG
jgi:DNA-binding SARP family transcriptional activator